jgi:hypothetical protein
MIEEVIVPTQKEKFLYDTKYTAGSYADLLLSMPIAAAQYVCKAAALRDKPPQALQWDEIKSKSPIYRLRERLRESLDTQPGMKYLVSNYVCLPPFYLIGAPAAEAAQGFIDQYLTNAPQIVQYASNAVVTISAQLAFGYATFQASEIVQNMDQYRTGGKLSAKKMLQGYWNTTKAFIKFDLPYIGGKIVGQSLFLGLGKDPASASNLFDAFGIPLWYTFTVSIGVRNNLLENKETRRRAQRTGNF